MNDHLALPSPLVPADQAAAQSRRRARRQANPKWANIDPHYQGSLDGLCGLYAVINAVVPLCPELTENRCKDLFAALMAALCKRRRDPVAMVCAGLGTKGLRRLLKRAVRFAAEELGVTLQVEGFAPEPATVDELWTAIRDAITASSVAIVGLSGRTGHWTVAIGVTPKSMRLLDSDGQRFLRRARCRFGVADSNYGISPEDIFVLRRRDGGASQEKERAAYRGRGRSVKRDQDRSVSGPAARSPADIRRALTDANISYAGLDGLLIALCRAEPRLLPFLTEGDRATRHYVGLCLAAVALRPPTAAELAELAGRIAFVSRRFLLGRLWGRDLGDPKRLARIAIDLMTAPQYRTLARLLADPVGRRRLAELPEITKFALNRLAEPPFRSAPAFNGRLIADLGVNQLLFIADGLVRLRPDLAPEDIHRRLNAFAGRDGIDRLIARLLIDLPLPAPPWPGEAGLSPILTVRELRQAGLRFANCLNRPAIWSTALRGDSAYYICDDERPLIAGFAFNRLFSNWYLQDLAGRNEAQPTAAQHRRIALAFAKAGIADLSKGGPATLMLEGL